jgi:NADP-dependent 3-hydroxy acid dehydrogenase YdfG
MTTTTASNKVCAIFGFGQGIGAAVARKYSKEGYKVAIISRSIDKLQTYEKTIPNSKGFACDVTKPDVINSTVDLIEKEFNNPIDVLVWNAGGGVWKVNK